MNPIFLYSKFTALVLKSAGWTQRLNELYVNGMQFSEIFFGWFFIAYPSWPKVRCSKQGDISGSIGAWNVSSANQSARISIVTKTINMRYYPSVRSKWLDNNSHCCSIISFLFWSTFRALSRHSLWSVSILFFNADSSPKTAPRPLKSAPTSSHTDHMWISVTGACSNRIPPQVAAKQVHVIWM